MVYLEVRCCCIPQKLLGYLPVDERNIRAGVRVGFQLRESDPSALRGVLAECRAIIKVERFSLEVAKIVEGHRSWLAFKSEETPLEVLRQVHGFQEARR